MYRRLSNRQLRSQNPDCEVKVNIAKGSSPTVIIDYKDGTTDNIDATKHKIDYILDSIQHTTERTENWNDTVKFKQNLINAGVIQK